MSLLRNNLGVQPVCTGRHIDRLKSGYKAGLGVGYLRKVALRSFDWDYYYNETIW